MGVVVRNMREGDMLEDEVGEGGHSGTMQNTEEFASGPGLSLLYAEI